MQATSGSPVVRSQALQLSVGLTPAGFVLGHIAPERHVIVCPVSALFCYPVREKIWANQFIEFHELLSPNPWAPSTSETEQHTSQEPAAEKAGRQQNTKREPLTLAQWTTAWNHFTAVLTVKLPELAPALVHHMEVVLRIAEKRGLGIL